MIRSNIGISKISVSSEIDPGFGPDTEQRRVEFAAKLEDEAFNISVGDATKLAKANLITALKLWEREDLIKHLKDMNLRDIMIVWIVFEVVYIFSVFEILSKEYLKEIVTSNKVFSKFIKVLNISLYSVLNDEITTKKFKKSHIKDIREMYGGDLIFSLKEKNQNEIIKIYQMTYSKLPKSLRERFYEIITGINIQFSDVISILRKKWNVKNIAELILNKIQNIDKIEKKDIDRMILLVSAFNKEMSEILKELNGKRSNIAEDSKEVESKVKNYYGIK